MATFKEKYPPREQPRSFYKEDFLQVSRDLEQHEKDQVPCVEDHDASPREGDIAYMNRVLEHGDRCSQRNRTLREIERRFEDLRRRIIRWSSGRD